MGFRTTIRNKQLTRASCCLIARNDRELFSSNHGVLHLNEARRIDELSRGSVLGLKFSQTTTVDHGTTGHKHQLNNKVRRSISAKIVLTSQLSRLYRICAGIKKFIPSIFYVTSFTVPSHALSFSTWRECAKFRTLASPTFITRRICHNSALHASHHPC